MPVLSHPRASRVVSTESVLASGWGEVQRNHKGRVGLRVLASVGFTHQAPHLPHPVSYSRAQTAAMQSELELNRSTKQSSLVNQA